MLARIALLALLAATAPPMAPPPRTPPPSTPGSGGDTSPIASGLVHSVEVASPAPVFVQHFRLDVGEARNARAPVGLARYVSGPDAEGGVHVELELELYSAGVRLIHVEQESVVRRRVVFREIGERAGRTLFLEGRPGGPLLGYELGGPEIVRRATEAGGCLPLVLLESLRRGARPPAELRVLDPLSAAFESLQLSLADEPAQVSEARRSDGSLRWRLAYSSGDLTELRFQERGPLARPIAREEYEHWRERHDLETRSAREAAAERARPWDELVAETRRAQLRR